MAGRQQRPAEHAHGPIEGGTALGIDERPERRPGVPLTGRAPPAADGRPAELARQPVPRGRFRRKGLQRMTPVFGTATPPRGLSGLLRRVAYRVPEHRARHWILLLGADRVDVVEGRIGDAFARPLRRRGHDRAARAVESNPTRLLLGVAIGVLAAGTAARRMVV